MHNRSNPSRRQPNPDLNCTTSPLQVVEEEVQQRAVSTLADFSVVGGGGGGRGRGGGGAGRGRGRGGGGGGGGGDGWEQAPAEAYR